MVEELDETGAVLARNIQGINPISRQDNTSDKAYYVYNGHGDVVDLLNPQGASLISYDYDAFGNTIEESGEGFDNPYRYAGEQYDEETGLYLMGARYYSSSIGRWISEDSYRGSPDDPLSLNLYVYVKNNPLIYVDPSGCVGEDID